MNRKHLATVFGIALIALFAGACKHSGIAITDEGSIINIDIDAPNDLAEGETGEVEVVVRNVGFSNLNDTIIQVEFPRELAVVSEEHGRGMVMLYGQAPNGNMMYQYDVGDIEVTQDSKARFEVRARFGSRDRTGDIKVLVWNDDISGDRLIETRAIRLRR